MNKHSLLPYALVKRLVEIRSRRILNKKDKFVFYFMIVSGKIFLIVIYKNYMKKCEDPAQKNRE